MSPVQVLIVIIPALAVLAGGGFILYKWWTVIRVPWKPLGVLDTGYFAKESINEEFLRAAVAAAEGALRIQTTWNSRDITRACTGLHIVIYSDDTYADDAHMRTGYEAQGNITVNRKLTTLCHEMAHACQERIEGVIDVDHVEWVPKRIDKAERSYSDWLVAAEKYK